MPFRPYQSHISHLIVPAHPSLPSSRSGRLPPRVSWKQRRLPDVPQAQPQHRDTVEPEAPASVRRAPHAERIDVVLEALAVRVQRRLHAAHPLRQHGRVVDTLGARHDLLAAHEGVVGVRERGVAGVEVGVEGASGSGVVREEVEVRVVLLQDEAAEAFFVGGAVGRTYVSVRL